LKRGIKKISKTTTKTAIAARRPRSTKTPKDYVSAEAFLIRKLREVIAGKFHFLLPPKKAYSKCSR